MKPLMITVFFLIFISAFPGTPARILPEHPLDKLIPLVQSPCIEKQSCRFSGRKTVHGTNPTQPPQSPTPPSGASPGKVTLRNFLYGEMADYGRTSRPPPPPPASSPPTKEVSITMAWYGRAAIPPPPFPTSATKEGSFTMAGYGRSSRPPPPPPKSAPPTKEVSITMPSYGRAAIPPPPSPTSLPPTKETSFTMLRDGREWTPPPPPSSVHQVAIIGLLLEKLPSSLSLADT